MAIEKEFGIEIPNEDAALITTPGQISAYVLKRLTAQGQRPSAGETWERVKSIVTYQLGVKPEKVTPDAHIVYDLGAD